MMGYDDRWKLYENPPLRFSELVGKTLRSKDVSGITILVKELKMGITFLPSVSYEIDWDVPLNNYPVFVVLVQGGVFDGKEFTMSGNEVLKRFE